MASKSKRNRQRRKRKEALLAAPDVAITVAVKEKKMGGGMMTPPEREMYAEGGKFPDLTGDGKVTQADILKGRDVFQEGGKAEESPLQLFDQMGKQGDNINWDRWTTLTSEDPTGPIDPASKKGLQLIQKLDRQRREYGDRTFTEAFTDAMFKKYPRGTKPLLAFLGDVKARRRFTKENPNLVETINSLKEYQKDLILVK